MVNGPLVRAVGLLLDSGWHTGPVRAALVTVVLSLFLAPSAAFAEQGTVVSRLSDKKIVEASGLAVSAQFPDVAYTLNDSGNKPMVYAVSISTGKTVGRADLSHYDLEDTESLYVDPRGQMWVGDLGDNLHSRKDVSILRFPEPGPGEHTIKHVERFGVRYSDGRADVEGMLVNPVNGQVFLASRNRLGGAGEIYALTTLQAGARNIATKLDVELPADVSDATFSEDGSVALLRTPSSVWVADPQGWTMRAQIKLPRPDKSESITFERGDRTFLVGGEGEDSPLIRAAMPAAVPAPTQSPQPAPADQPLTASEDVLLAAVPGVGISTKLVAVVASVVIAVLFVVAMARRRHN